MKVSVVFAAIFLIAVIIAGGLIGKDRLDVLTHSESYNATVVECIWHRTRSSSKGRTRASRGMSSYQPIAVSKEGYSAKGRLKVSSKKYCKKMIGHEVTILVDKDHPKEARIYSFFQFWLAPFGLLMAVLFVLANAFKATKTSLAIFFGSFIILGVNFAAEFKLLNNTKISPNLNIVDPNLALDICINEAKREQNVKEPSSLKRLSCTNRYVTDISRLTSLTALEELDLSLNDIIDVTPLSSLKQLRSLKLDGNRELMSIEGLEGLTDLGVLKLHCAGLTRIDPIKELRKLRHLDVSCNELTDLSAITNLDRLETLNIDTNRALADIKPVANKPDLEVITMYHTAVSDLSPLMANEKLRSINLGGGRGVFSCEQVEKLRARLVKRGMMRGPRNCQKKPSQ